MLDPRIVEEVASALATEPGLIEKEWHVVRAIGVIAKLDHGDARPVFSGGTSLSVAWRLIKRFSEDVDFKVALPAELTYSQARARRRNYRGNVVMALTKSEFTLVGEPMSRNASQFFRADFAYPNQFNPPAGFRPHIRVELNFQSPRLQAVERSLQSLVAQGQNRDPEIAAFPCVDPVETASDKLSALAWRVCTRNRGAEDDDPTVIRHLHDLAALEQIATNSSGFPRLVQEAMTDDADRGGAEAPRTPAERFALMFELLNRDRLWAEEYDQFVHDKSFAKPEETISFAAALDAVRRLQKLANRI